MAWRSHGEERVTLRAHGYNLVDPLLTAEGTRQAEQLRAALSTVHIDYVVCSPLRRALVTADLGFPNVGNRIVQPTIRERCGGRGRLCDTGRGKDASIDVVSSEAWDFSHLDESYGSCASLNVTKADVREGRVDESRESTHSMRRRVAEFTEYIGSLPTGSTIAAVGHGDFWQEVTTQLYAQPTRLGNCGFVLCDENGIRDVHPGFGPCSLSQPAESSKLSGSLLAAPTLKPVADQISQVSSC